MRPKPPKKCPKILRRAAKDEPAKDPPLSTWDAAAKLLETTPASVLGISRPVFLGLLGGLSALARDFVGDPSVVKELRRVENVCLAASILDLANGVTRASPKPEEKWKWTCVACMLGHGAHSHPTINAPGGTDVRPS